MNVNDFTPLPEFIFSGNKLNLSTFLALCYIFNQYCASDKGGTGSPIIGLSEYLSNVTTI